MSTSESQPPNPAPEDSKPEAPAEATPRLTPEEQMELYEQELKEKDWGHQPC